MYCLVKGCHKVKLDKLEVHQIAGNFSSHENTYQLLQAPIIHLCQRGCDEEGVGKTEDRCQYGLSHGGINTIIHIQAFASFKSTTELS